MSEALAVTYTVTAEDIAAKRLAYDVLAADTPQGYESVRVAIADCRATRTSIEKRRVELKADALAFGRRVDSIARELTSLIESIEEPLRLKKAAVDDARERAKAEKEAEARRIVEEELRIEREARETQEHAAREAEEKRLAEERERLAAERAEIERQRAESEARERAASEALRAEKEALETERQRLEAEKRAAEHAEFERLAKIRAEAEAKELARLAVIAAEEERIAEAERAEGHRKRLEALKPDKDKLAAFAARLREAEAPIVKTRDGKRALAVAVAALEEIATALEAFGSP